MTSGGSRSKEPGLPAILVPLGRLITEKERATRGTRHVPDDQGTQHYRHARDHARKTRPSTGTPQCRNLAPSLRSVIDRGPRSVLGFPAHTFRHCILARRGRFIVWSLRRIGRSGGFVALKNRERIGGRGRSGGVGFTLRAAPESARRPPMWNSTAEGPH